MQLQKYCTTQVPIAGASLLVLLTRKGSFSLKQQRERKQKERDDAKRLREKWLRCKAAAGLQKHLEQVERHWEATNVEAAAVYAEVLQLQQAWSL